MYFKNLTIYKFTKEFTLDTEKFNDIIAEGEFKKIGSANLSSRGWVQPLGSDSKLFTHTVNQCVMICQRTDTKVLPAAAVNAILKEHVEKREDQECRKLTRKEKRDIKDEIYFDMIPKAFTVTTLLYAYIDIKNQLLIVDSNSNKRAEELCTHLREMLGSLPVIPLTTALLPDQTMTEWLKKQESPEGISITDNCILQHPAEPADIVKFSSHDLGSDEVQEMMQNGHWVKSLGLRNGDKASFVLDKHFTIKKLKFTDIVMEQAGNAESREELFDIEFTLMTGEIDRLVNALVKHFGGFTNISEKAEQMELTGLHQPKDSDADEANLDAFYKEAIEYVLNSGSISLTGLQRQLKISSHVAAIIIKHMQDLGWVSEPDANGTRSVNLDKMQKEVNQ